MRRWNADKSGGGEAAGSPGSAGNVGAADVIEQEQWSVKG